MTKLDLPVVQEDEQEHGAVGGAAPMADGACCEHERWQHGRECDLYDTDSRHEVCLECPGYSYDDGVTLAYPRGKAWHRYRPAAISVIDHIEEDAANDE